MKKIISIFILLIGISVLLIGQNQLPDTIKAIKLEKVVIGANRLPVLYKSNPRLMIHQVLPPIYTMLTGE